MQTRWNLKFWLPACLAGAVFAGGQSLAVAQEEDAAENQNQSQEDEQSQTQKEREASEESQTDARTKMGAFEGIDDKELRIKINDETQRFETNEQTRVTINGQRSQLDELKAGDRIRVTTDENGAIEMVAATRGGQSQDQATRDPQSPREQAQRGQTQRRPMPQGQDEGRQQQGQGPVTLGVRLGPSPTTGVLIRDVQPQGPAEQAGLQNGDYILRINETKIEDIDAFDQALAQVQPGGRAEITIWRDSEEQQLVVNFPDQRQAAFRPEEGQPQRGQQRRGQVQGRGQMQEDQGWLGVLLDDAQEGEQGVRIVNIYPSGPASRAGLRQGDVIVEVDNQQVMTPDDAVEIISSTQPNEQLDVVVLRDGQEEQITVMLADRRDFFQQNPQFGGEFGEQRGFREDSGLIPEHAMMLEQHRRFAEQHQRIEERLDQVLSELQELRSQLGQTSTRPGQERPGQPGEPGTPGEPGQDQPEQSQPATPEQPEPGEE
ncbi:MAG: PDZ domain-containing protein [Planctomycetaceae bacterium]